jgi:hypothetical protein
MGQKGIGLKHKAALENPHASIEKKDVFDLKSMGA